MCEKVREQSSFTLKGNTRLALLSMMATELKKQLRIATITSSIAGDFETVTALGETEAELNSLIEEYMLYMDEGFKRVYGCTLDEAHTDPRFAHERNFNADDIKGN
jgi:hypothetical protein